MRKLIVSASVVFSILLSGCSAVPVAEQLVGPDLQRDTWDKPSEVFHDLQNLPSPRGKMVASVYSFRDLTGQYKPQPSSSFSTAVSQGAASILIKAIKDSGWFSPLEREGLQDLLTERKIIRASMKANGGDVPPLLGANILLEGGIIGYETNMKTGGAGAKYFGIGMSEQYRVDQVTVNLRAVDVNSGRVINSVTTNRSILSRAVQGGAFRFVRFKRLLEVEAGYTRNEPVQLCLTEAIQAAVMRIVVEGVEDKSWALASASDADHPLLFKYGRREAPKFVAEYKTVAKKKPAGARPVIARRQETPQADRILNTAEIDLSKKKIKKKTLSAKTTPSKVIAPKTVLSASNVNTRVVRKSTNAAPAVNVHETLIKKHDGEWVIQLMSSGSAMEVVEFARKHHLPRNMIEYIYYKDKGQDRFAILYGQFKSKTLALKAIESLPPKLRIFEPWVRTLKSIS